MLITSALPKVMLEMLVVVHWQGHCKTKNLSLMILYFTGNDIGDDGLISLSVALAGDQHDNWFDLDLSHNQAFTSVRVVGPLYTLGKPRLPLERHYTTRCCIQ